MNHEQIAAKLSELLGREVDAAFIARAERLSGKPILDMTIEDWDRTAELNAIELAEAERELGISRN